jgi:hypothetical protein
MRLFGLIALLLAWPTLAQDPDINGYSTVLVRSAGFYSIGVTADIRPYLMEAASAAGFEVIERRGLVTEGNVARTLEMLIAFRTSQGGTISVVVFDVRTGTRVASATHPIRGLRSGTKRALREGAQALFDGLGYSGYDPAAHQRNLLALERAQSSD